MASHEVGPLLAMSSNPAAADQQAEEKAPEPEAEEESDDDMDGFSLFD